MGRLTNVELIFCLFNGRRSAKHSVKASDVKLRFAVIGIDTVDFLFNIGQLGVGEPGDVGVFEQYVGQSSDSLLDLRS